MSHGHLAQVFLTAMHIWDSDKALGVPRDARLHALEATLRQAWPQVREWKFLCPQCDDLGLEIRDCVGDATCGRPKAHLAHTFGRPCWCALGTRFKDKPKPTAEDFTAAGRAKPMTRVGR
jgi:hypothetical protein